MDDFGHLTVTLTRMSPRMWFQQYTMAESGKAARTALVMDASRSTTYTPRESLLSACGTSWTAARGC